MGRQIRFLMVGDDEAEFIDAIHKNGDSIFDCMGNILTKEEAMQDTFELMQVYIKSPQTVIKKWFTGYVDPFSSNVIELIRSRIKDKRIGCGRLYIQTTGLDENVTIKRTEKWLEEKYGFYKKWILKHCKISKDKSAYVGKMTYSLYKAGGYKLVADLGKPEFDYVLEFE
jgi:hypothetical protein